MLLQAILRLNTSGFTGPLNGVRSALSGTIGRLASLAGAVISVRVAMNGLRSALDMGGKLSDENAITGIPIADLVVLKQAFEDTGVGAGNTTRIISQLQRAMGGLNEEGEPTNKVFEQLGLSIDSLKGLSAIQQLEAVKQAITAIRDPAQQTAAIMGIFGRGSYQLKSFFADPGAIDTARRALGGMSADGAAAAAVLKDLKLSAATLSTMDAGARMQSLQAAIAALPDPAARAAASLKVFGSNADVAAAIAALPDAAARAAASLKAFGSSGALLGSFAAGLKEVNAAGKSGGGLPEIMARNAAVFDRIRDSFGRIKMKLMGLWAGVAESLLPVISSIARYVDRIDLSGIGRTLGDGIAVALEGFRTGRIGEIISLSLLTAFGNVVNFIVGTLGSASLWTGIAKIAVGAIAGAFFGIAGVLHQWIPYANRALGTLVETSMEMIAQGAGDLKDAVQPANFIDTAKWKRELSGVFGDLHASVDAKRRALQAEGGAGAAGGAGAMDLATTAAASAKASKAQALAMGSWANVGLFAVKNPGQLSNPVVDYNRRTAAATERTARWTEQMASYIRSQPKGEAAWAGA